MTRSPTASVRAARSSAAGENGSSKNDWEAWKTFPAPADPGFFPPELVVRVKAVACEFPAHVGEPLSRWSVAELGSHVRACGLTASLSDTTIWRWLNEDAIRPWQHRCWIFPRDPDFETKAGRILDLCQRLWKGRKLATNEFVLSADEKTSIQARCRKAASLPAQPGQPMKVEHESERRGAWAYLAALDVHQAKLFGRCEAKTGIAPLIAWSIKSCNSIPIAGREGFSGSSTTVLRIEVPGQSKGSRASIPTWCSFTGPSMPVGSIKSKSISRSSNERS